MSRALAAAATVCLVLLAPPPVRADPPALWDETPYRVAIRLTAEGPRLSQEEHRSNLVAGLRARLAARIGSLWVTDLEIAEGEPAEETPSDEIIDRFDKLLLVSVTEDQGVSIRAREYDTTVSRWGEPVHRRTLEHAMLAETLTAAISQAFRPLAAFDLDTDDASVVHLTFRGAKLLPDSPLVQAPDAAVLLPYPLLLDRQGKPVRELSKPTPWTYLIREPELDEQHGGPCARVVSNTRLPFGARRSGRIEQLALVLRSNDQDPTTLRIVDQSDSSVGLRGYEVFFTPIGQRKPLTRVGRTDGQGEVVFAGEVGAVMAHIRCGASVVASLPIVPGAEPRITVPLLNEVARLQAETRLNQLQEELVDVSAQRTILVQRVRSQLESGKQKRAESLMREIDKLPARAQFSQKLNRIAELYRADHPVSQKRLEKLYEMTREAIASTFDASELRDLESQVISARNRGG